MTEEHGGPVLRLGYQTALWRWTDTAGSGVCVISVTVNQWEDVLQFIRSQAGELLALARADEAKERASALFQLPPLWSKG